MWEGLIILHLIKRWNSVEVKWAVLKLFYFMIKHMDDLTCHVAHEIAISHIALINIFTGDRKTVANAEFANS